MKTRVIGEDADAWKIESNQKSLTKDKGLDAITHDTSGSIQEIKQLLTDNPGERKSIRS